jgi:hypothetical protein
MFFSQFKLFKLNKSQDKNIENPWIRVIVKKFLNFWSNLYHFKILSDAITEFKVFEASVLELLEGFLLIN